MFELVLHPTASRGCEGLTTSPSLTYTSRTVPATVVTMSFCIFIASSTATTSPSLTASPGSTGIFTMSPCIGAITVPSPNLGAEGLAAGACEAAAVPPPGTTVMPAPLTRTLNTSPSTSTSNSAVFDTAAGPGLAWDGAGTGAGTGSGGSAALTATGGFFSTAGGAGSCTVPIARVGCSSVMSA